ncbi:DUF4190 domain-containing protein [Streptomyces sp. TRM43335]|uniref:DUF4190 domain-containing protein n=1 Tax=Streptomyces taklimakanensis TaxID=2569853 RepID=A0A6G2BAS2_9ACTN|nr:DUF4190 domain-containing protein [Streptomyces taklimakanensis]
MSSQSPYHGHPHTPGPGAAPSGPAGGRPPRNGLGIAALVLGVIALLLFWTLLGGIVLGLAAIVLGIVGRRRAKRGEATNGGMALAGAVVGGLGLVASVALVVAGVSFLNSDEFKNFEDCVNRAETAADREQCERDFNRDLGGLEG